MTRKPCRSPTKAAPKSSDISSKTKQRKHEKKSGGCKGREKEAGRSEPRWMRGVAVLPFERYTGNMYISITFNPAAFKHGISKADIRLAILNALYDDVLDGMDDKHLVLGFGSNGILLEILYNIINEDAVNVFHAMKCRDIFLPLLKNIGGLYGRND
jgi:hypothetical protein